jgi:Cdc6-like AAA superfamily ATPase
MPSRFELENQPQSLSEFSFPNEQVKRVIYSYVEGKETRPLLLYGTEGVGKSTLARLLVSELTDGREQAHEFDADIFVDTTYERIRSYFGLTTTYWNLISQSNNAYFNGFFICDEFRLPSISDKATQIVKKFFDKLPPTVLMVMTNNLDTFRNIDSAVTDRCVLLKVPPTIPSVFLPYAKTILERNNVSIDEQKLLRVLQQCYQQKGSSRNYYGALSQLI